MAGTGVNKSLRKKLIANNGTTCIACGDPTDPQADHIVPQSEGGSDDLDNLHILCGYCNRVKGAKPLSEFLRFWAKTPDRPKTPGEALRNARRKD